MNAAFVDRRRLLGRLTALLGLGGGPACAWSTGSAARDLRVVIGPDSPSQRQILQALAARLSGLRAEADPQAFEPRRPGSVCVAIGPAALRRALTMVGAPASSSAAGAEPLISLFTSSQTYQQIVAEAQRPGLTAIYAEAAPLHQMQLVRAVFERRVVVGVLVSGATAYLERLLRQAAAATDLDLQVERVEPFADVVRALNRLSAADVLLAVPDSTLYTPATLRAVLESSYRRRLPVVGFSTATVAAGTLATAYANIDDTVSDLVDLLSDLHGGAVPEPRFPQYWRVAFNDNVARSFGLSISPRMRALGRKPPEPRE